MMKRDKTGYLYQFGSEWGGERWEWVWVLWINVYIARIANEVVKQKQNHTTGKMRLFIYSVLFLYDVRENRKRKNK